MKAIGVIVLALLVGVIILATQPAKPGARDRANERRAIDRCHDAVADELSELETRRFMRQACRLMEDEYRRKWGRDP